MNHYLPEQRAIAGCRHPYGRIMECNPDRVGKPQDLVWFCKSCPFQAPLSLGRVGDLWKVTPSVHDG